MKRMSPHKILRMNEVEKPPFGFGDQIMIDENSAIVVDCNYDWEIETYVLEARVSTCDMNNESVNKDYFLRPNGKWFGNGKAHNILLCTEE